VFRLALVEPDEPWNKCFKHWLNRFFARTLIPGIYFSWTSLCLWVFIVVFGQTWKVVLTSRKWMVYWRNLKSSKWKQASIAFMTSASSLFSSSAINSSNYRTN
jgi:hypothetical protein